MSAADGQGKPGQYVVTLDDQPTSKHPTQAEAVAAAREQSTGTTAAVSVWFFPADGTSPTVVVAAAPRIGHTR